MVMRYKFQHFMDIETSASSMNIIQVNAGGEYVRQRCKHLFNTYKYFKLGKVSIKLIPAATLPVDPQGLSYDVDDPYTVDPRDQMNPGLVRITNGEDLLTDLTNLSTGYQDAIYRSTMMDTRWSKFMLQSGFKRTAYPLYWNLGSLHQSNYPQAIINEPVTEVDTAISENQPYVVGTYANEVFVSEGTTHRVGHNASDPRGIFQVGHRGRLSWLPVDAYEKVTAVHTPKEGEPVYANDWTPELHPIPEIPLITIIMPRAYKTIYHYRLFITEEVLFKGIRNVGIESVESGSVYEFNGIDNFTHCFYPQAWDPRKFTLAMNPMPRNTTPNDGSDDV